MLKMDEQLLKGYVQADKWQGAVLQARIAAGVDRQTDGQHALADCAGLS